ncbi:sentrin-specific protease 2 [Electrophorus electricus]|uniref:Ubiquitin-like protease family profile domain-containing protein n=1 Tax=Electrophorus electricus TaxID=8005 RepID=A0A4W4HDK0_ELEEL|nr:sentrin-specific protease 2 [Electrophorus electricus]
MYGWIVDGLSSLFVPFTSGNSHGHGYGNGRPPPRATVTAATGQDCSVRPAKRSYESVHSPDGISEHLEIKRPRRDVIVRVFKKTFAGITGLLRLRQHKPCHSEKGKGKRKTQVGHVAVMGIDELNSNSLNKWMVSGDVKMEKPAEIGLPSKEKAFPNFYQSAQPLMRKPDGPNLYMGNQDRQRERQHRMSLQLLPSCAGMGLSEMDPPARTHKPSLTVEEALKESDREHYRKLVEMVSEKYSKNKPLPFGRVKPQTTTFPLDGHKPFSRTVELSKPVPIRVNPTVSVWRGSTLVSHTKDRKVDVTCGTLVSDARDKTLGERSSKKTVPVDVDLSVEVETRLNLKDREAFAVYLPSTQTWSELLPDTGKRCDEEFPRLTKEMQQEVSAALAQRDPNLVLSSAFKLRITQRDLATLQEGSWLNDEVINFYLNLVMARGEQTLGGRKVYCFSTFFFPKLLAGGHHAVRRWTKAVDLFLYDVVLVPLHLGVHWSLAAVEFRSKSVRSYDSMGQRHDDICNLIMMYLKEEYRIKKGKDLETLKWTVTSTRSAEVPQQRNGSDCGVFVCKYADCIARAQPFSFRQCHMTYFRKAMIWEILKQRLLQ